MKKQIAFLLILAAALSLCACGHQHSWTDATCTEPKTCADCGETEGEALGHEADWAVTKEPSLLEEGEEALVCSRCGELLETRSLEKKSTAFQNGAFSFTEEDFLACFFASFDGQLTAEKCEDGLVMTGKDAYRLFLYGTELAYLSFEKTEGGEVQAIYFQTESFDGMNLAITSFNLLRGNELLKTRDIFFALTDYKEYTEGDLKLTMDAADGVVVITLTGK